MKFRPSLIFHIFFHMFLYTHYLGIEVVKVMDYKGLYAHGFLGRSPLLNPMMADNNKRENISDLLRETLDFFN